MIIDEEHSRVTGSWTDQQDDQYIQIHIRLINYPISILFKLTPLFKYFSICIYNIFISKTMELLLPPQPMHFSASPYPTIVLLPFLPALYQQVSSLLLSQHPVKRNKFRMYCIRYDFEQIFSHLGSFWFSRNGGTHAWDSEFEIGNCRRKIPLPIISLALFFVTNSTFILYLY